MLTPKQEKFIQNIIKGMSQREAYKDSYNATYDDNAIDVKACELFNSDKVQVRYKELMQQLEDTSIMSAKERMKWLTDVIKNIQRDDVYVRDNEGNETLIGSKNADINTKLKAIDTLNKMSGEYITKIDADVNSDVNINIEFSDD